MIILTISFLLVLVSIYLISKESKKDLFYITGGLAACLLITHLLRIVLMMVAGLS